MEENTVTEELTREQKYEKTREFIQDWANKNMNYLKLLGNEDKDFRELGASECFYKTFKEAFKDYSGPDIYSQGAISNFAFEKGAAYYSMAVRVNYEYAEKAFNSYVKSKDQDEKRTFISECLHYVNAASDNLKRATTLVDDLRFWCQFRSKGRVHSCTFATADYALSEVDIAVDFAIRASAIAQKLVKKLIRYGRKV